LYKRKNIPFPLFISFFPYVLQNDLILDFNYDRNQYTAVEKAFSESEYFDPYDVRKAFCNMQLKLFLFFTCLSITDNNKLKVK